MYAQLLSIDNHIIILCTFSHHAISLLSAQQGTYCPVGSDRPLQCPPGMFCEDYANDIPDGDCSAGYYCNGSAEVRDPAPCSPGYYCPEGTTVEEPCPPGTFSRKNYFYLFCNHVSAKMPLALHFLFSVTVSFLLDIIGFEEIISVLWSIVFFLQITRECLFVALRTRSTEGRFCADETNYSLSLYRKKALVSNRYLVSDRPTSSQPHIFKSGVSSHNNPTHTLLFTMCVHV